MTENVKVKIWNSWNESRSWSNMNKQISVTWSCGNRSKVSEQQAERQTGYWRGHRASRTLKVEQQSRLLNGVWNAVSQNQEKLRQHEISEKASAMHTQCVWRIEHATIAQIAAPCCGIINASCVAENLHCRSSQNAALNSWWNAFPLGIARSKLSLLAVSADLQSQPSFAPARKCEAQCTVNTCCLTTH